MNNLWNDLRMAVAEILLRYAIQVAPVNDEGILLCKSICIYLLERHPHAITQDRKIWAENWIRNKDND